MTGGSTRACPGSLEWPRQRRRVERLAAALSEAWASWARRLAVCSRHGAPAKRTRQPACQDSTLRVTWGVSAMACVTQPCQGHTCRVWRSLPRALRASGDGTEAVPALTAAGTEAHRGHGMGSRVGRVNPEPLLAPSFCGELSVALLALSSCQYAKPVGFHGGPRRTVRGVRWKAQANTQTLAIRGVPEDFLSPGA